MEIFSLLLKGLCFHTNLTMLTGWQSTGFGEVSFHCGWLGLMRKVSVFKKG